LQLQQLALVALNCRAAASAVAASLHAVVNQSSTGTVCILRHIAGLCLPCAFLASITVFSHATLHQQHQVRIA
jgi:hypothetical protein